MVKSHGSADSFGFQFAISRAYEEAKSELPVLISARLQTLQVEVAT